MKNNFFRLPLGNINSKPSHNSEVSSQILYGEKFKIISKKKAGLKSKQTLINMLDLLNKGNLIKTLNPNIKYIN